MLLGNVKPEIDTPLALHLHTSTPTSFLMQPQPHLPAMPQSHRPVRQGKRNTTPNPAADPWIHAFPIRMRIRFFLSLRIVFYILQGYLFTYLLAHGYRGTSFGNMSIAGSDAYITRQTASASSTLNSCRQPWDFALHSTGLNRSAPSISHTSRR